MAPFSTVLWSATASFFETVLPTTEPSVTSDPWQYATHTFESFFDVPKPTGKLLDALLDHGDAIQKGCKSTLTDAMGMPVCIFPRQSDWCAFTESAPSSFLPAYSSYGSVASSWWAAYSSEAVKYADYCPKAWFEAMTALPYGPVWLNDTIAFADCHAAAQTSGGITAVSEATATTGLKLTDVGATATATGELNSGAVAMGGNNWRVAATLAIGVVIMN
ncbi:hypothetical protein FBEOM_3232 [Fusarium beomiforme]|uniref:DUF7735 domain-containing protein n=1 Tax=Fusarium beomiforme TaxID=44412 RepID=A0A9P5E261_9HYPO|nr:hypothetical protein FBEOM_3232 [Fusarium beomiforme]